jgi:hypothetical protein
MLVAGDSFQVSVAAVRTASRAFVDSAREQVAHHRR